MPIFRAGEFFSLALWARFFLNYPQLILLNRGVGGGGGGHPCSYYTRDFFPFYDYNVVLGVSKAVFGVRKADFGLRKQISDCES